MNNRFQKFMNRITKSEMASSMRDCFANNSNFCKFVAFTLAEILITLGIIGIVAAMTIPTLIQKQQRIIFATRAKQSYAQILNAIRLSEAQNGDYASWDFVMAEDSDENTQLFLDKYLLPYFSGIKFCAEHGSRKCGAWVSKYDRIYTLNNGVSMAIVIKSNDNPYEAGHISVIFDVNGAKKPNNIGTDQFYFTTNGNSKKVLKPYGWKPGVTIDEIKSENLLDPVGDSIKCLEGAVSDGTSLDRHACTLWLYLNDWKMDKDYPW